MFDDAGHTELVVLDFDQRFYDAFNKGWVRRDEGAH